MKILKGEETIIVKNKQKTTVQFYIHILFENYFTTIEVKAYLFQHRLPANSVNKLQIYCEV